MRIKRSRNILQDAASVEPSSQSINPRIVWVIRSFLDYHIPVFAALDEQVGHQLFVIYSKDFVPVRVCAKIENILGPRAVGLTGEWKFGQEDLHYEANALHSIRFHPGLMKAIKKCKPDVMIGDGFFKWTVAALLYRIIHGVPLIVCYERTSHTERYAQWYRVAYRKFVMRWIDAMCCNGRLCGEYVQSLGFKAERIAYGHMVADTKTLSEKAVSITQQKIDAIRQKFDIKGLCFLFVGQLTDRKGVHHLLESWSKFEHARPAPGTLLIVGEGPDEGTLQNQAKKLSLSSVRFIGAVDYDQIADYYATADVFVIPTLEDNWSLVVPEAMACGLPILCSKYNGCWPELVHSGENGWVFDPLDHEDILRCLIECLDNKDRLKQMGEKSKVIVSDYTPEKAAESILRACRIAEARH
jgi:glycosyltransferase involved in cell wall biosynthesis